MRKSNKIVKPRPHYHVLYGAGIEQRKLRAHLKAIICIGNAIIQKKNNISWVYLYLTMNLCGDFYNRVSKWIQNLKKQSFLWKIESKAKRAHFMLNFGLLRINPGDRLDQMSKMHNAIHCLTF